MYIVQVTGYGENGTGDANDVWRLEIPGAKDGEVVLTVVSKFVYRLVSVGGIFFLFFEKEGVILYVCLKVLMIIIIVQ